MTDNRKIQAEIGLDATGFKDGAGQVSAAADAMAAKVGQAGDKAGKSIDNMGAKATDAAFSTERASRSMEASLQRQIAALTAGAKGTSDFYKVLIDQRGLDQSRFAPLLATLDTLKVKTDGATHATEAHSFSMGSSQAKVEALRIAHDALIGSYARMGSSSLVLANATGLSAAVFTAAAIPMLALVAAVGAVAFAYYKGSQETDNYRKALINTGNAAGTTVGQMQASAQAIAATTRITQSAAAEAITALAATGSVAGSQLQRFGQVTAEVAHATGAAVAEIAKNFADLAKDPVAASVKLNDTLHYLTLSTYEQISALEKQGKTEQAGIAAQKAYADAMENRAKTMTENLGYIEKAWAAIASESKKAWDAMMGLGRKADPADEIKKSLESAQAALADSKKNQDYSPQLQKAEQARLGVLIAGYKSQLDAIGEVNHLKDVSAQKDAADAALVQKKIAWDKEMSANATNAQKQQKETLSYQNEYGVLLSKGIITQKQYQQGLDDIARRYRDNDGISKAKAARDKEIADIDRALQQQVDAYSKANGLLDSLHAAGVISDKAFHDAKVLNIQSITDASVKAADADVAIMQKMKLTGADKENNDKKIIEIQAKKAKAIQDGAAAISAANLAEADSVTALADKYTKAKEAIDAYSASVNRGYDRNLAAQGMTSRQAADAAGLAQVADTYANRVATKQSALDAAPAGATERRAELQKELDAEKSAQTEALAKWGVYFNAKVAGEKSATNGMTKALGDYADNAGTNAANVANAYTTAFKSMEDALVAFAMTGKLNFKTMTDGIIADLIRMQIQASITGPLAASMKSAGGIGGLVSSFFADGGVMTSSGAQNLPVKAYAGGGVANSPQVAVFGEGKMNEAYVPLPDGRTIPVTMQGGGGGNVTVNQPLVINAPNAGPQTVAQIQSMMPGLIATNAKVVEGVIRQAMRRGGGRMV